jgi:hypothetical protein
MVYWKVCRNCCQSGNCIICMTATPLGVPVRVEHAVNVSEVWAKECARNYSPGFLAVAMPMNQRDYLHALSMARTGPREWVCQQVDCGKKFTDGEQALQHARSCTGGSHVG